MSDVPPPPPPFPPGPAGSPSFPPAPPPAPGGWPTSAAGVPGPPAYGAAPYGVPPAYGGSPMGMSPSRSGKAVAGFVLGLISIILFLTIVVPLLALIFGVLGLREIGRSNGMRTGRGMAITGVVLGTLGLLGGGALWVVIGHEVATTTGATELEVGQCVKLPGADATEVFRFDDQDCDKPHQAEVFAIGDLGSGDDPYPGVSEVQSQIETLCRPAFADYVGIDFDSSVFQVTTVYPQESTWKTNQEYACLAFDPSGDTTGSIRGVQR